MLNAIAIHVQAIPTNSHYNKRDDLLQLFFVLPDVNFQHFNEYYPNGDFIEKVKYYFDAYKFHFA